jgi:catalase
VKYHLKTDQGIKSLIADDAARIAGHDGDYHQRDLLHAIDRAEYPS